MNDLRQHAKAVWIYAIHHTLEREGLDSQAVFSAHNFDFSSLESVNDNVSRDVVNALWRSAVNFSGDDAFCLKTIDFINEPFINALVSVTRASQSIRNALDVLQRFHTLISPELRLDIDASSQLTIKVWNVEELGDWLPEDRDITLAIIAKHGLAIAAKEIKPLSLSLTRCKPNNESAYRNLFECDIEWGAAENYITYPAEVLDLNIPSANTHMFGHFESYLEKSLEKQQYKDTPEPLYLKVENYLTSELGPDVPTLTQTAQHFHMSASSFKKHLQAEGSHYQQLLDKVREMQARKLIKNDSIPFKEISYRLGFANSSAFNKAFKRWTGVRPSEFSKQKTTAPKANTSNKEISIKVDANV